MRCSTLFRAFLGCALGSKRDSVLAKNPANFIGVGVKLFSQLVGAVITRVIKLNDVIVCIRAHTNPIL